LLGPVAFLLAVQSGLLQRYRGPVARAPGQGESGQA
jgi:hypothetical protein